MQLKILIVEDVFIEADHLSIILTKAGHTVTAIAKSVDQALKLYKKDIPDLVMLDIFLKGPLTGIHFAGILAKQGIPFIYLSANSNPSTLHAAKETNPEGFLVKPFREKDILVALDIAIHRRRKATQLRARQEKWLGGLLKSLVNEAATQDHKMLLLIRAFHQSIPFDHIHIEMDGPESPASAMHWYQRSGRDEFRRIDVSESEKGLQERLRTTFRIQSTLPITVMEPSGRTSRLTFFSTDTNGFNVEHSELLRVLIPLIGSSLESIRLHANTPARPHRGTRNGRRDNDDLLKDIVGTSPKLQHVLGMVRQVALVSSTVLIYGETGVGKEGVAAAIHGLSDRRNKPFVKINCAGMPTTLIESELFGHERGAFTDATGRRIGKFEQAQGGTILLDEIGEMPLTAQTKLLRVLQEKEFERIGGDHVIKLDVRVIAATNRDLLEEISEGRFRMDLYYRLNVFPILVPSLRERKPDIPLLVEHFLRKMANSTGKPAKELSRAAIEQMMNYSWPGNIRELQHVLERHSVMSPGDLIDRIDLPSLDPQRAAPSTAPGFSPTPSEKEQIYAALDKCQGKVSGPGGAAELLGINPNTLATRMRKLGIRRDFSAG